MQAAFRSDLVTRLVDEFDDIHQLEQPLVFDSLVLAPGGLVRIVVPAGFKTDLASVPRIVGAYLLFGNKGKRAAVVHDWLYSGGINVTREAADAVFREALQATGYNRLTVAAMYAGVRLGGASRFTAPNVPQIAQVAALMEAA
ncbi:MAG TPA: DUF1353 domain-containing protein [Ramlibacter sp.]|jgi:hypothetical protein